MNEETQITENAIYSYKTKDGLTCHTPNANFAHSRSIVHGNEDVYVEYTSIEKN